MWIVSERLCVFLGVEVLDLKCRGCGAPITINDTICKYCGGPVAISTFNSVNSMPLPMVNKYANSYRKDLQNNPFDVNANKATAYCYLKLKMYDKALDCFEKAVEDNFDDSEVYFYAAICCLKGKKAFLAQRAEINKAEEFLNAALMIEPKGIYYYLWAYIKYDYFKRKFLNTTPNYLDMLNAEKGIKADRPSMHMVFTGNPGTAKTTVARLFAQIMKDNGLLTKGDLYEVGRADIVGQFVGQTAPLVKKHFNMAKGSVLFIDEAYSLVDDRNGLYGDEAINTIVQEMENNRSDLVVIFAGYPDKMEEFLNKNPGLRSRIAFHVNFDDYSTDELIDIADLMIKKTGFKFTGEAHKKLGEVFDAARKKQDFGNGRYVRNLIELSSLKQASRLAKSDIDHLTDDEMRTITVADIAVPLLSRDDGKMAAIGF